MDKLLQWGPIAGALLCGAFTISVGSGYLAKSQDLSQQDIRNQQTFAQSSDLQNLKTDTNKRLDDMNSQMDKRFDRLENDIRDLQTLIITGRYQKEEEKK